MKVNLSILFLFLLLTFLLVKSAGAQNISNDTISVSIASVVQIIFPSLPMEAKLPIADGSYEVDGSSSNNSIFIKAKKKEVKDQPLIVTEGSRTHHFILTFREDVTRLRIDWSDLKKLKAHVKEKTIEVAKALSEADHLYNQQSWKEAQVKYRQLLNVGDNVVATHVKSRLIDINKRKQEITEKDYTIAINIANSYFSSKKYEEARQAYLKVLTFRPSDTVALNKIKIIDQARFAEYLRKGDEADHSKNYVLAKANYEEALKLIRKHFVVFRINLMS
jgi:tetratricopeptide (TPR) repeat protein